MPSTLYPFGKQALLSAGFNLLTDTIAAVIVDTGTYAYSPEHQFVSSITGVQGAPAVLTGKSVTLGVFDADDTAFARPSGLTVEAVVLYKNTGSPSTSPLLAYIDGLTVTLNGRDVALVWDQGPAKIFAL